MSSIEAEDSEGEAVFFLPEAPEESRFSEAKEYSIVPTTKTFTKEFTVLHKHWPTWVISTNRYAKSFFAFFDWRTHYTISNATSGEVIAYAIKDYGLSLRGIYNLSFLGIILSHTLSDFNVYDKDGNYIGFIDGKVLDISQARFDFSDRAGNTKAYARLEGVKVAVRDYNSNHILAHMQRKFDVGCMDSWSISCMNALDPRILFIFAAYVVDHQSHFIKDI